MEMFNRLCIDASVFISFFLGEPNSEDIFSLFTKIEKSSLKLIEPSYLDIEVMSTLRNKAYSKNITELNSRRLLDNYLAFEFSSIQVSRKLLKLAYNHAVKCNQPVIYDCIYSALAEEQKALFVTADDKFLKKIRHIYPKSYSVVEAIGQIRN